MNDPHGDSAADSPQLSALERAVLEAALASVAVPEAQFHSQIEAMSVATRTPSGVGFMTRFAVPDSLSVPDRPADETLPTVVGDHPGLPSGAEFIVQIKAGRLHTIEAFCFEGMWPGDESQFRVSPGP